jgi:hypothetical protein
MLERTKTRMLPLLNQAAEAAPAATTCCNACRTCVTTNLLGVAAAGLVAVAAGTRRIFTRAVPTS